MESQWIKISEKLPKEQELVLLYDKRKKEQHIGWYDGKCFCWGEYSTSELDDEEISHWHPLPENPV